MSLVATGKDSILTDWKAIMLPEDVARLAQLQSDWASALNAAKQSGFGRATANEGALLDPNAGLVRPAPSPGRYHCRIVRIGKRANGPSFERFKPFYCFIDIDAGMLTFVKETGTWRPGGRLWEDGDKRLIFMGGVAKDDDEGPPAYGADPARNSTGIIERIGDFVWRMTLTRNIDGDGLEIIEMTPSALASQTAQAAPKS